MKLKIFLFLLIPFSLMLFSCKQGNTDYLSYQQYPMKAEGLLTVEELGCDISVTVEESGRADITINSPEKLQDYRFTVDKEGVWVYYDDIGIPLTEDMLPDGLSMLSDMFSIDPEALSEIGRDKIGGTEHLRLVYDCGRSTAVVYIKEGDKIPTLIEMINAESGIMFAVDNIEY